MAVERPQFVRGFRISPRPSKNRTEFLSIRLDIQYGSPLEFDMKPNVAMSLMRSLQDFQRRYHWQVPVVSVLKPSKKP